MDWKDLVSVSHTPHLKTIRRYRVEVDGTMTERIIQGRLSQISTGFVTNPIMQHSSLWLPIWGVLSQL